MLKCFETHFEEYINEVSRINLNPKVEKCYSRFPTNIEQFKNLIFYGPSGVGKYSQMLYSIKQYSPTELKYEKKLSVTYDKEQYYFKISDIHYEVDMSLLGCNSKLLWHEIFQQILDVLSAKKNKTGIIVCKEFHSIHNELLENFYSYMQDNNASPVNVKFILLSEEISFIPDTILNCCEVIHIPRPTKTAYSKCSKRKLPSDIKVEDIKNIKHLHSGIYDLKQPYKLICNKLFNDMINIDELKFLKVRDSIYDIFIYNLSVGECIWYILTKLINENYLSEKHISEILIKTYDFLKYYNNNYRPIYHLESYLYYLIKTIHGY